MINSLKGKWGFDSYFLVYILDRNSPYFPKTSQFIKTVHSKIDFNIAQQNILEAERIFINIYKLKKEEVITKIEDFLEAFNFSILCPLPSTIFKYHQLLRTYKLKDIFDIFLAATYQDNNINNLFTMNTKDFHGIVNFNVVNPLTLVK